MPDRVMDHRFFFAESKLLDWLAIAQGRDVDYTPSTQDPETTNPRIGLRWHVQANRDMGGSGARLGLPTGPFTVWRRPPVGLARVEKELRLEEPAGEFLGMRLVVFDRVVSAVTLTVTSPAGGPVLGLGNAPMARSMSTWEQAPAGVDQVVRLRGGHVNGVLVPPSMTVGGAVGTTPEDFVDADGWDEVEIVGLPADETWERVGTHADRQGPVGALVSPVQAARLRILAGAPPYGWDQHVNPAVLAPPWVAPHPDDLLAELADPLLPALREALQEPQGLQHAHRIHAEMDPPANSDGRRMEGEAQDAQVGTTSLVQMAVSTDPFMNLALGFGTTLTYRQVDPTDDLMVTVPYAKGIGGPPQDMELATIVPRPRVGFPPPVPTELASDHRADLAPVGPDQNWRAVVMTRWDRPLQALVSRTASYAATRHEPGAAIATPLMEPRPGGGHIPVAPALDGTGGDDLGHFVHHADREVEIENDPGTRNLLYGIANTDLFGVWSPWGQSPVQVVQPEPTGPRILAAGLQVAPAADGSTNCPAALTVDLTWDWTDRRPEWLWLVGSMYHANDRADFGGLPPGVPGHLQRFVAGGGQPFGLEFTGDTPTLSGTFGAGSSVVGLSPEGDEEVAFGPQQGDGPRRYRVHVTGLVADVGATGHVGVALWAVGRERIAPNRIAASAAPFHAWASDPSAPPVPPELVPLASLPDAAGRSHANIAWAHAPGAVGYIVYGSDETTLREHFGMGQPDQGTTLSDRVTALLDAWEGPPDDDTPPPRKPFTRVTPELVDDTSTELLLPRGTTDIAAFVVISMGAGGVEGPWPGPGERDSLVVRAVPRIARPTTPSLEARLVDGMVDITVRTRPGHRVGRIDLHCVRVDAAAASLDTMGPPVAEVTETTPQWSVTTDDEHGTPLAFEGTHAPSPSWRRVWYRAACWAADTWDDGGETPYQIAERGLLVGRSEPSNAIALLVPPPGPPNLSEVAVDVQGGTRLVLTWSTTAALVTPSGPHRLELDVRASGADEPLFAHASALAEVAQVGLVGADGLWRGAGEGTTVFTAVGTRDDRDTPVDVLVRLADPIGRTSEQILHVPASGFVLPPPILGDLKADVLDDGRTLLQFTSTAPLDRPDGAGHVLVVRAFPATRPHREGGRSGVRPGRLSSTSRRDEQDQPRRDDPAPETARGKKVPPERPRRPLRVEVALRDVVVDRGQPAGEGELEVRRQRGAGPVRNYSVLTATAVAAFEVRLRAAGGRTTTARVEVEPR